MRVRNFCALILFASPLFAFAATITREEAMQAAFPGAEIQSSMVFLTDQQMKDASKISGVSVNTALVAVYKAVKDGTELGRAYLDTHVVRTKKESLLIILDSTGKLKRVEVVTFLEPPEYMPPDIWY